MQTAITYAQIAVSVLLIAADGTAFRTKRGLEKGLFYATIVLSVVFLGLGLALIIVS